MNNSHSDNDIDSENVDKRIIHIRHRSYDHFGTHYSRKYDRDSLQIPKLTILRRSQSDNRNIISHNDSAHYNKENKKNNILNVLNDSTVNYDNNINENDRKPTEKGWYYVNKNGQTKGPVSTRRIKILYNAKQLKKHNYLWNGFDIKHWTQLKHIKTLYDQLIEENKNEQKELEISNDNEYKNQIFIDTIHTNNSKNNTENTNQKPMKCVNYPLCNQKIFKNDLKFHLKYKCNERNVKCLYYKIGCVTVMKYKQLNKHLNDYIIKHNQLQYQYIHIIKNTHKYHYISKHSNNKINGLYERVDNVSVHFDNEINETIIKPIYKKQINSSIYLKFNMKCNKYVFETKDKNILSVAFFSDLNNICNTNNNYKLIGFSDLYLFNELNLLKCAQFIQITGRLGINIDMNGIYEKQNELHNNKPWYLKIKDNNKNNNNNNKKKKNEWVIRYFEPSELWLFDKRGLRNDDIANGIGHGNTLSPLEINKWEIHNGKSFVLDEQIKLTKYSSIPFHYS